MADDNQNEQSGSGLRAQLEEALDRIKELEGQVEVGQNAQRELAFTKAGIDTSEGPGKLLAKTYDGELDPDAITSFAEEYGINVGQQGQSQEPAEQEQTQQRVDALRRESQPEGTGKRLAFSEWRELSKADPQAAQAAHAEGRVDFPSHIAQDLAAREGAA